MVLLARFYTKFDGQDPADIFYSKGQFREVECCAVLDADDALQAYRRVFKREPAPGLDDELAEYFSVKYRPPWMWFEATALVYFRVADVIVENEVHTDNGHGDGDVGTVPVDGANASEVRCGGVPPRVQRPTPCEP